MSDTKAIRRRQVSVALDETRWRGPQGISLDDLRDFLRTHEHFVTRHRALDILLGLCEAELVERVGVKRFKAAPPVEMEGARIDFAAEFVRRRGVARHREKQRA